MEMKYLFILMFLSIVCGAPEHREDGHYDKDGKHSDEHDHQIFLGGEQQKEFDEMNAEQSVQRLGKLFDKIDKNGDSNVTLSELSEWIKYISLKEPSDVAKKDYHKVFREQLAGDGLLSWKEYLDIHFPGKHQTLPTSQERIETYRRRFTNADVDKDWKLSAEEYVAYRQPHLFAYMHNVVVDEVMKGLDLDKDGKITLKDRLAAYGAEEENNVKQEFELRDKNENGVLDDDEVKEWYFPTIYDVNENEAKHLITRADTNKDGVLTKTETLDNHDVFVGSKATHWGETLKRPTDEL